LTLKKLTINPMIVLLHHCRGHELYDELLLLWDATVYPGFAHFTLLHLLGTERGGG
jgi:hypothetical protein